jgi:hypothetical protein
MSSADVGDAVDIIFTAATGATVAVTWLDPDQATVVDAQPVTETPSGSGRYPVTFVLTRAGTWTAQFTASGTATAVEQFYLRAAALTGPPPLAVLGDVAGQYGTLTTAQQTLTNVLLRAASKMIRSRFPTVDAQIVTGRLDPDIVALAAVNMVLRVLRNPGGLRSETVGPFSRTFDTSAAAGLLVVTDDELSLLTPGLPAGAGLASFGVGTIRVQVGLAPPCHRSWGGERGAGRW